MIFQASPAWKKIKYVDILARLGYLVGIRLNKETLNESERDNPADSKLEQGKTIAFSEVEDDRSVGAKFTTKVTEKNSAAGDDKGKITYKSSNQEVATVDQNTGEVTALKAGQTTITATKAATPNKYREYKAQYTLTVSDLPKGDEINFNRTKESKTTAAADTPFNNPANKTAVTAGDDGGSITYESSVPEVATVDRNSGEITPVKAGDVTITATKAPSDKYLHSIRYQFAVHPAPGGSADSR